jgi:hypothetical protein
MANDLAARLQAAKERLQQRSKLLAMLDEAGLLLDQELTKRRELAATVASEKAEVERLEGYSLAALFHSVFGNIDEKRIKEQKEFLAAQLKLEEAEKEIPELEQEVKSLRNRLRAYAELETEYRALVAEKEQFLLGRGDASSAELLELVEQLGTLAGLKQELAEAIDAGEAAYAELVLVSDNLRSAQSWGTFDMFAGGAMTTMFKHSKIDTARQHVARAQHLLHRFQEELADAGNRLSVSLEIGGMAKFADYFFDGIITDWIVQSKINAAAENCGRTQAEVRAALDACRRRLAETEAQIVASETRRCEIIDAD